MASMLVAVTGIETRPPTLLAKVFRTRREEISAGTQMR
jgi:hypothetical protein